MICEYCGQDKPEDRFAVCKRTEDKVYRRNKCKDCRNKDKRRRRRKITEKVERVKKEAVCNRCGFEDHRALQFHHTKDDKEFTIGEYRGKGWGWKTLKSEIEKCEIVCANCHRIEHYR